MSVPNVLKELFYRFVPGSDITSADAWYARVKPTYPRITRTEMRTAWNAINKGTGYRDVIPNIPPNQRIPWQWGKKTTQTQFDKWTLKFTWTAKEPETGAEWQEAFFYTSNKLFTVGDATTRIAEEIEDYSEKYELTSVGFVLGGFYKRV